MLKNNSESFGYIHFTFFLNLHKIKVQVRPAVESEAKQCKILIN